MKFRTKDIRVREFEYERKNEGPCTLTNTTITDNGFNNFRFEEIRSTWSEKGEVTIQFGSEYLKFELGKLIEMGKCKKPFWQWLFRRKIK